MSIRSPSDGLPLGDWEFDRPHSYFDVQSEEETPLDRPEGCYPVERPFPRVTWTGGGTDTRRTTSTYNFDVFTEHKFIRKTETGPSPRRFSSNTFHVPFPGLEVVTVTSRVRPSSYGVPR